jgi:hypothetical protein
MRRAVSSLLPLLALACGGSTASTPAVGSCAGTALVSSEPVTLASSPGASAPFFPGPPPSDQAGSTPGGFLVVTGAGAMGAAGSIEASLITPAGQSVPRVQTIAIGGASPAQLRDVAISPVDGRAMVVFTAGKANATTVVTIENGAPHATTPLALTAPPSAYNSLVAWDGDGFALLAGQPQGLVLQRFAPDGSPAGGTQTFSSTGEVLVAGAVATSNGAAVVWQDTELHASLIDSKGDMTRDAILASGNTGGAALAWTGQRLLAAVSDASASPGMIVRDLGWFGEPGWQTTIANAGRIGDIIEANGKILVLASMGTDPSLPLAVYQAEPGQPFSMLRTVASPALLGADGCGHVLVASAPPTNTGNPYQHGGPWTVEVLGASEHIEVGSDLSYMYMGGGSFVSMPGGVGFIWGEDSQGAASPSTVRFASLTWR